MLCYHNQLLLLTPASDTQYSLHFARAAKGFSSEKFQPKLHVFESLWRFSALPQRRRRKSRIFSLQDPTQSV